MELKKSKEYYNKLFSILKQKITTSLLNQIDKIISEFKIFLISLIIILTIFYHYLM